MTQQPRVVLPTQGRMTMRWLTWLSAPTTYVYRAPEGYVAIGPGEGSVWRVRVRSREEVLVYRNESWYWDFGGRGNPHLGWWTTVCAGLVLLARGRSFTQSRLRQLLISCRSPRDLRSWYQLCIELVEPSRAA